MAHFPQLAPERSSELEVAVIPEGEGVGVGITSWEPRLRAGGCRRETRVSDPTLGSVLGARGGGLVPTVAPVRHGAWTPALPQSGRSPYSTSSVRITRSAPRQTQRIPTEPTFQPPPSQGPSTDGSSYLMLCFPRVSPSLTPPRRISKQRPSWPGARPACLAATPPGPRLPRQARQGSGVA